MAGRASNVRHRTLLLTGLAAFTVAACGMASPQTQLPDIDHTRPATLLNAKQKDAVSKDMAKIADDQNKRAAAMPAVVRAADTKTR